MKGYRLGLTEEARFIGVTSMKILICGVQDLITTICSGNMLKNTFLKTLHCDIGWYGGTDLMAREYVKRNIYQ